MGDTFNPSVEYRDVVGFPGYRVGEDGTVWSCHVRFGIGDPKWKKLQQHLRGKGNKKYLSVNLRRDGKLWDRKVHVLVLLAFRCPKPIGMEGCHNDDNEFDNHAENLRWDTHSNNAKDRNKNGHTARGESSGLSKLSEIAAVKIRWLSLIGIRNKELAEMFCCSDSEISDIALGEIWKHIGGPIRKKHRGRRKNVPLRNVGGECA